MEVFKRDKLSFGTHFSTMLVYISHLPVMRSEFSIHLLVHSFIHVFGLSKHSTDNYEEGTQDLWRHRAKWWWWCLVTPLSYSGLYYQ
jgi:hypothetical protein